MTYEFWNIEVRDGVSVAGLNTGPMNYMTGPALGEFKDIINSWRDPSVRVGVITGDVPNKYITHYSVEETLRSAKSKNVTADLLLSQASGEFAPVIETWYGDLVVTAQQDGSNTRLEIKAIANVDHIYALGRSPGEALIEKLKEGLQGIPGTTLEALESVVPEHAGHVLGQMARRDISEVDDLHDVAHRHPDHNPHIA